MKDHCNALRALAIGDIFHAQTPDGVNLICLVTSVNETEIRARTVTSQMLLVFDRHTGVASWGRDMCRIDSVRPLPLEIRDVLLALDQKYQNDQKTGFKRSEAEFRLSTVEKQALLFTGTFYGENRF